MSREKEFYFRCHLYIPLSLVDFHGGIVVIESLRKQIDTVIQQLNNNVIFVCEKLSAFLQNLRRETFS